MWCSFLKTINVTFLVMVDFQIFPQFVTFKIKFKFTITICFVVFNLLTSYHLVQPSPPWLFWTHFIQGTKQYWALGSMELPLLKFAFSYGQFVLYGTYSVDCQIVEFFYIDCSSAPTPKEIDPAVLCRVAYGHVSSTLYLLHSFLRAFGFIISCGPGLLVCLWYGLGLKHLSNLLAILSFSLRAT